jgi:hypothetical protein
MDDAKPQIVSTPLSPELPQQLDPDFYREARLHIARLTAERLLRERSRIVKKKNRHSSGCDPMVVAEHSAEALSALNRVMG